MSLLIDDLPSEEHKMIMKRADKVAKAGMSLMIAGANNCAEVYVVAEGNVIMGFHAKRNKAAFYYAFPDASGAKKYAEKFIADAEKNHAEMNKAPKLVVGDILYASWGYDQTNIDYYEVVKVSGLSVTVAEIASERVYVNDSMTGNSVPVPGKIIGEPMRRKVMQGEVVRITSFAFARKMEPISNVAGIKVYAPQAYSSYA